MAKVTFAVIERDGQYIVEKRNGDGKRGTVSHFPTSEAAAEAAQRYATCYDNATVTIEAQPSRRVAMACLPL